ncbi:MAG: autotransporter domain-containing protein [Chlamydiae bacterium]|nr:autotransporter domain-containing protein [Chlamydiota bacterium]
MMISNANVTSTNSGNITNIAITAASALLPNSLTITNGSLLLNNTGSITSSSIAFIPLIGNGLVSNSFINLDQSNLTLSNSAPITVEATSTFGATGNQVSASTDITLTNSTLQIMNSGAVTATIGGTQNVMGNSLSSATLTLTSSTFSMNNSGAVLSTANSGIPVGCDVIALTSLTINDGTVNLSNTGSVTGIERTSGVRFRTNGLLTINGGSISLTNTGPVTGGISGGPNFGVALAGTTMIMNGGTLTNSNSGTASGHSFGSAVVAHALTQNGGLFVNDANLLADTYSIAGPATYAGVGTASPFLLPTLKVTNAGTVIPGDPGPGGIPGVMTMNGSYIQTPSGTLVINVQNASTFSQLLISGTAQLSGTLEVAESPNPSISASDTFLILIADGGVAGTFDNLVNFNFSNLSPHVRYFPTAVQLYFSASTQKYIKLSQPLFSSLNETNTRLNREMERLRGHFAKPAAQRISASKKQSTSSHTLPVHLASHQIDEPLSSFIEDQDEKLSYAYDQPQDVVVQEKRERLTESLGAEERPWNFYVGPKGQLGNVVSRKDTQGYEQWSAGAFTGFDYAFSEVGVGLLTEYERVSAHVGKDWGKFTIDHLHTNAYATYAPSQLPEIAINGIIGGGYEWYTIDRNIGATSKVKGTPRGAELDALLGIEYTFRNSVFSAIPDGFQVIPMASVQYAYLHIDDFKEKGITSNCLKIERQNVKSLRSNLGMRALYTWKTNNVEFSPAVNFNWQREFLDKAYTLDFTPLVFSEFGFSLEIPKSGRNIALAGVDFLVTLFDRHGLEAGYDFEYNSLYHTHFLYMSYNVRF